MDEFDESPASGTPRRTTETLLPMQRQGTVYPARDGYLLTARGNPYSNVVRDGQRVVVHTAGGKDRVLEPLKLREQEKALSLAGRVAMQSIPRHIERMECYTCHTAWAPQCYACHVKIDYSGGRSSSNTGRITLQ